MLVLPDTPQYANINRGVWVFRIADGLPYYSNGVRWVANTGGLGPAAISDSLTAYNSRVVTSFNGKRGAVQGVDSIWFTNLGSVMNWRFNNITYSQSVSGGSGVPDSTVFATINYVNTNFATLLSLNAKQNISDTNAMLFPYLRKIDTTGRFLTSAFVRNDSFYVVKNGAEIFLTRLGGSSSSNDNLDSVVRRGAFTTIDSFGIAGRVIFRNQGGLVGNIAVRSSLNDQNITISNNVITFRTSGNLIGLGFESPTGTHFPRIPTSNGTLISNVILNGVTYNGSSNGTADLGTITGSADSSIFAPQFRLDSTRNGIRQDLNAKLNISVAAATYQPIDSSLLAANHNARKKYTEISEFLPATFSSGTYINNTNFQQVFGGGAIFYSQQDTANG